MMFRRLPGRRALVVVFYWIIAFVVFECRTLHDWINNIQRSYDSASLTRRFKYSRLRGRTLCVSEQSCAQRTLHEQIAERMRTLLFAIANDGVEVHDQSWRFDTSNPYVKCACTSRGARRSACVVCGVWSHDWSWDAESYDLWVV